MYLDLAVREFGPPVRPHERGDWRTFWCKFHPDRRPGGRPNLRVNIRTGHYVCMRCGARGRLEDPQGGFEQEMEAMVREAIRGLAGSPAESYLAERGIPPEVARGRLGYWPGGRIGKMKIGEAALIPVYQNGRLARLKFRILSPSRKEDRYRGIRVLDGTAPLICGGGRIALVVEGELDAILLSRFYPYTIGMGGRSATLPIHSALVLIPDNDEGGRSVEASRGWAAVFRIAPFFKDVTDLWKAMGDEAVAWVVRRAIQGVPFSPHRACLAADWIRLGRDPVGWCTPLEAWCAEILISRNGEAEDEIANIIGSALAQEVVRLAKQASDRCG